MNAPTSFMLIFVGGAALLWPNSAGHNGRLSVLAEAGRVGSIRRPVGANPTATAFLDLSRRHVLILGAAVAMIVVALGGRLLGVPAAIGSIAVLTASQRAIQGRAQRRDRQSLLRAVTMLQVELVAGSRPAQALAAAAAAVESSDFFESFVAAAQVATEGGDVAETLLMSPKSQLIALAGAWRLASVTGAPIASVLGKVADDLREASAREDAVATALAGPRSSALLLSGLPVLGLVLGTAMGAHPFAVLTGSLGGQAVCAVGVLLDVAGVAWTARLTSSAARPSDSARLRTQT